MKRYFVSYWAISGKDAGFGNIEVKFRPITSHEDVMRLAAGIQEKYKLSQPPVIINWKEFEEPEDANGAELLR